MHLSTYPLGYRKKLSKELLELHPNHVPIVLELHDPNGDFKMKKSKFIVPTNITLGRFSVTVRENLTLTAYSSLLFFINDNDILSPNLIISVLYNKYRHEDGFLYVKCQVESTFGTI